MLRLLICVVLLGLASADASGARRLDVKRLLQRAWQKRHGIPDSVTSFQYKRDAGRLTMRELDEVISVDDDSKLQVVKTMTTAQGTRLIKMQELFKDHKVMDGVVTVETDADGEHVLDASGIVHSHIDLQLDPSRDLDPQEALAACLRHNHEETLQPDVSHVKVEEQILFDDDQMPYPAYLAQYLVLDQGKERRPTCILNARDAHVTMAWDALDTCTDCSAIGVGGNVKIGKIQYGQLQRCLDLRKENGVCYLENRYVRVINNNFTEVEVDSEKAEAEVAFYDCHQMEDEVNGAYSPMLDALFYGTVVGRMYEDWYNTTPHGDTMTFRVHYGVNVSNAFWNGYECQYGDGGKEFYPLISLDIVSHEVAHGVTEKNSNLYYFHQWGGINEAFSDMAGETAEAYLSEADWLIGIDISKSHTPLRYFEKPELDKVSISHVDNYTDFLDPHFGSGVYNRVFYLLVHDYGLPIRDVFHVFLHANQMYWHHMSTYSQAACDVMKSAYDLGQDGSKFRKAFAEVGLDTCDLQDHVLGLRIGEAYGDITVSKHVTPFFVFGVPGEFVDQVNVKASSLQGDVYIVASNKTWAAEEDVEVYAQGLSALQFRLPTNTSTHVSLTLSTDSEIPLTDVVLQASYRCVEDYTPSDEHEYSYYIYFLWREYCLLKDDNDSQDSDSDSSEEETPSDEDDEGEEDDDEEKDDKGEDDKGEEDGKGEEEDKEEEDGKGEEEDKEGEEDNAEEDGHSHDDESKEGGKSGESTDAPLKTEQPEVHNDDNVHPKIFLQIELH